VFPQHPLGLLLVIKVCNITGDGGKKTTEKVNEDHLDEMMATICAAARPQTSSKNRAGTKKWEWKVLPNPSAPIKPRATEGGFPKWGGILWAIAVGPQENIGGGGKRTKCR